MNNSGSKFRILNIAHNQEETEPTGHDEFARFSGEKEPHAKAYSKSRPSPLIVHVVVLGELHETGDDFWAKNGLSITNDQLPVYHCATLNKYIPLRKTLFRKIFSRITTRPPR